MDDVKSVLLNILSSFLHTGLVWIFCWGLAKYKANQITSHSTTPASPPVPRNMPKNVATPSPIDLGVWGYTAITYFFTAFLIYFSISTPPTLKAVFSNSPVLLSDAAYIGHFLPSIPLTADYFQWTFVIASVLLFIPCMSIASLVNKSVIGLLPFVATNPRIKFGIHYITVAALCAPIAASSIVLFFGKSYKDAFSYVGLTALIIVALATSEKK